MLKISGCNKLSYIEEGGGDFMAVFVCKECGNEKDARCKPKKCPSCEAKDTYEKKENK
jgi:rubrerythrin